MNDELTGLTSLAVEGLAIYIRPTEVFTLKMLATYGQVLSVSMVAIPLWITLGGMPVISQSPPLQQDFPRHVMSQSQETVTHGPQVSADGGSRKIALAGHARASCRLLGATLTFKTA